LEAPQRGSAAGRVRAADARGLSWPERRGPPVDGAAACIRASTQATPGGASNSSAFRSTSGPTRSPAVRRRSWGLRWPSGRGPRCCCWTSRSRTWTARPTRVHPGPAGCVRSEGSTALLSSHIVTDVEDACDRLVILGGGKIRLDCPLEEARQTHRLTEADSPPPGATAVGSFLGKGGQKVMTLWRLATSPTAKARPMGGRDWGCRPVPRSRQPGRRRAGLPRRRARARACS